MKKIILIVVLAAWAGSLGSAVAQQSKKTWPFYKPTELAFPKLKNKNWPRNGIDHFILANLEEKGLTPAHEASRRTLIRRLYYDLIGLPPSPAEVSAFLNDKSKNAYEKVVDRLLKDSRYGERWARYWLDLARYADTAGYEGDPDLPHAWRYRDYVIDAFNKDKPYDLFIKEQIAGDEFAKVLGAGDLPDVKPERIVAMTFLRLAPFTEPRGDETRHELLSEITGTVGSVFLGLTVGCAKCHNHKYDKIPIRDFYRLQAFFSTIQIARPERGDGFQIGGPLPAAFYRPGEKAWADQLRAKFTKEIGESKQKFAEFKATLRKNLKVAGAKRPLDAALHDENGPFSKQDRQQYYSLANRERFLKQQLKRLRPLAMSLRHSYGPPYEPSVPVTRIMLRGNHDSPGAAVKAGFLSCITGHQEPAKIRLDPFKRWPTRSRRMALAEWIASPDNPMTARVMVNRLWYRHFGRGIVATPSDFGKLGGGPSHRKLLDWLAVQFVKKRWSIKAMHRLMVTSATYRQASVHPSELADSKSNTKNQKLIDPENILLWKFNRRRLEAEAIRDGILSVSGRLNPKQFGLPIFPPLPDDIDKRVKYSENKWNTQYGPEGRRRSIYIYQQRTLNMPFLQVNDATVCDESRPRRRTSVTPLQALAMYNGDFVNEEAKHFAWRVGKHAGDNVGKQIRYAFELALGRPATKVEAARLERFIRNNERADQALIGLCRILLNTNEFVYID